jgi:hypothetical protein
MASNQEETDTAIATLRAYVGLMPKRLDAMRQRYLRDLDTIEAELAELRTQVAGQGSERAEGDHPDEQ